MDNNDNNNTTGGEVLAPWDPQNMNPNNLDPAQAAAWRERERRQRTVRLFMMFLLMLLLMDSEEQAGRKRAEKKQHRDRHSGRSRLSADVFGARRSQEMRLQELTQKHPRYAALTELNHGKNVPVDVLSWAEQHAEMVKDEFVVNINNSKEPQEKPPLDPEEKTKVFHYPWNATGFYRGEWTRETALELQDSEPIEGSRVEEKKMSDAVMSSSTVGEGEELGASEKAAANVLPIQYMDAQALETEMRRALKKHEEQIGVLLLPAGKEVILPYDHSNFTSYDWQRYSSTPPNRGADHYFMRKKISGETITRATDGHSKRADFSGERGTTDPNPSTATAKVTLTKPSGRAAFQLFSRSIPGMQEISLVDGFLKLYDSNMLGYSTHKDILLRVRGVLIHAIGRMSLVSNAGPGRGVLVLGDNGNNEGDDDVADEGAESVPLDQRRRRLQEALAKLDESSTSHSDVSLDQIRDDAIALFGSEQAREKEEGRQLKFESLPDIGRHDDTDNAEIEGTPEGTGGKPVLKTVTRERRTKALGENGSTWNEHRDSHHGETLSREGATDLNKSNMEDNVSSPAKDSWSDVVIPYPFVFDDENGTIRHTKTAAARKMPAREQLLEKNAGICEFEVTMDTKEVEWTLGEWRKMVERRVKEAMGLNPANHPIEDENEDSADKVVRSDRKSHRLSYPSSKSTTSSREHRKSKPIEDQALVMTMSGSIHSPNCDFVASLNVTALRTDWEQTTGKAINYSFYMMLACLTQIMVLLRQLLHTQARSAATRVSLLCIGWQTMIDAILCLIHIYLSLAIKPLFTAFASVAFFKWLIFCFIEMKYWTLIVQARNSTNGGNTTTEQLRRQVAMLHVRFYVALFGAKILFTFVGDKYRILFALALYSFWVPQIVQNAITEAKRPMHTCYIYGMSLSRLVAPLYFFAVPNNFLKEVYPESPTDPFMCELLVLWVGIQTAVLIAQGKYGTRFMIPARFLPPKFDYSRPIPLSILPPGTTQDATPELAPRQDRKSDASSGLEEAQSLLPSEPAVRDRQGVTTRNRIKGSRLNRQENSMTTETVVNETDASAAGHTLDCVICYNAIDVHNRRGYMLAPCDHIFHRDCLVQWMDVKMECPICRTELPSL